MRRVGAAAAAAALLVLLTGCGSMTTAPTYSPSVTVAPSSTAPSASPSTPPTAAASAPAETPEPATAPAPDDPGRPEDQCPDDALGVTIVRSADGGGAGSASFAVLITNTGGDTCVLRGAPRVAVVDSRDGPRIGPAAERDQDGAAVALEAGAAAVSMLRITDIGTAGGPLDGCTVSSGGGYRVVPPHSERAVFVEDPSASACVEGPVFMSVGPVLAQ